eukprot:TRINITY_DN55137_c0_g1_i1.p1 TRINITY_DN55137_c0_g1~~TRINITY_DN55137_c0_g1_i1.p1  ORF type:complete len:410 (+),score=117.36 TRINITY_DN55137_c0_g1_i1:155-1231(+)
MRHMKHDEIVQKGKAVSVGAEDWLHHQKNVHTMVETHTESIASLSKSLRTIEQQVKAMARVMATQNVQKLNENMKTAIEDLRRDMEEHVSDCKSDLEEKMEKESLDHVAKRAALNRKIDENEEKLVNLVSMRLEESSRKSQMLADKVERAVERMSDGPALVQKETAGLRDLFNGKLTELKKQMQAQETANRTAQLSVDKAVLNLASDLKERGDMLMAKVLNDNKQLLQNLESNSNTLLEKVKHVKDDLTAESKERDNMFKTIMDQVQDMVTEVKHSTERNFAMQDSGVERKVTKMTNTIQEVRQALEHERTTRESAVNDLTRRIGQEKKERDMDEDKLLAMISSCMATLDKMHQAAQH